ncbi:MAG TPA: hypothetical protein VMH87_16215 [Pseudomonadales bacterium]|nr:hypothetical protein [Pseudomonadales bacterium]
MKLRTYIFCTLLSAGAWPVAAAPADTNAPVQSVFTMPSTPSEGRDPFFPDSMRPYEDSMVKVKRPVELTSLQIKGFSQIGEQRYVIINNHTFGAGDEGDVITPDGRIHIKCLSVGIDTVMVESGGAQHLLRMTGQH